MNERATTDNMSGNNFNGTAGGDGIGSTAVDNGRHLLARGRKGRRAPSPQPQEGRGHAPGLASQTVECVWVQTVQLARLCHARACK